MSLTNNSRRGYDFGIDSATCSTTLNLPDPPICRESNYDHICGNEWYPIFRKANCSGVREVGDDASSAGFESRFVFAVIPTRMGNLSSATICNIEYGITTANITQDVFTSQIEFADKLLSGPVRLLPNLTKHDFSEMMFVNLKTAGPELIVESTLPSNPTRDAGDTLLQLLYERLKRPEDLTVLVQSSVFVDNVKSILEGISNEFARQMLLVPRIEQKLADGMISKDRLYLRPYSLWTCIAGFILMTICSFLIMSTLPRNRWAHGDTNSILSQISILVGSHSARSLFRDKSHYRSNQLQSSLQGAVFGLRQSSTGVVLELSGQVPIEPTTVQDDKSKDKSGWLPLAARLPIVTLTLALPTLIIATLQVLHWQSNRRNGLVDMVNDSTGLSYAVRILSTILVVLVAALYSNLEFTISSFAPFSSLRMGNAAVSRSLLFNPHSFTPGVLIYTSIRRRQFGVTAASLTALIGGLLTIVASGLWTVGDPAELERFSQGLVEPWSSGWLRNSSNDKGAAVELNIARHLGGPTQSSIMDNFVLPNVFQSTLDQNLPRGDHRFTSYTYNIPAIAGTLDCIIIADEAIDVQSTVSRKEMGQMGSWRNVSDITITVRASVPSGCTNTSSSSLSFSWRFETLSAWVGKYFDLESGTAGLNSNLCPAVGIVYGQLNEYSSKQLTALVCSQGIEQRQVQATFLGDPSARPLDPSNRLQFVPDTVSRWENGSTGSRTFGYKLSPHFENLASYAEQYNEHIDRFFDQLLNRPDTNITREEILGPENAEKLIEVVTRDYREYMAFVIDRNFRSSNYQESDPTTEGSESMIPVNGTAVELRRRLKIHGTSAIVLQALLGCMVLLGLVGYARVKIRGTLPREPYSIASTMAFLAGSQMCEPGAGIIPLGASFMKEPDLVRALNPWVFSLGWWDRNEAVSGLETSAEQPITRDMGSDSVSGAGQSRLAGVANRDTSPWGMTIFGSVLMLAGRCCQAFLSKACGGAKDARRVGTQSQKVLMSKMCIFRYGTFMLYFIENDSICVHLS